MTYQSIHRKQGGGPVFAYLCTILTLACSAANWDGGAERSDPRETYGRAAAAIADGELSLAIELLRDLTYHPDSAAPLTDSAAPLSIVAAYHLAECYLMTDQPARSLEVLQQWSRSMATDAAAARLQPKLPDQLVGLVTETCRALESTEHSVACLQSFVEHLSDESEHNAAVAEEKEPIDQMRRIAVEELTRRLFRLHRFADALTLLETHGHQRVAVSQRLSEPRLTEYGIKLAWANHDLQHGQADLAVERLQELLDAPKLQAQELEAVQFALSEAYIANNQPDLALQQLEQLVQLEQLEQHIDSVAANWQASVALRRGELLVKLRRSREAIPLLEHAKQAYPDFAQRHEFDYLLARSAIADIDFDRAREHLCNVVDSPTAAGSDAVLRAQWMIGETHLLQRDYSQAVVAYEQVTASAGKSPWRVRAWVQAGKCFELSNQSQRAVESYAAALQAESLEDESLVATRQEAQERIEIVQASLSASRDHKRLSNRQ